MKNTETVLSVKFNSKHSVENLMKICNEDLEIFRSVPGLIQKYYISEDGTGALSGWYIFKTKEAREAFWNSELAKNIPSRYAVIESTLRVEKFDMAIVLNDAVLT